MKAVRSLCLVLTATFLLTLGALAEQKHHAGFTLAEDAQVGNTQLKAGDYKAEWTGDGPSVQVQIMKGSKTVATVPAQVVPQKEAVANTDVILKPGDNGTKTVDQIDFAKLKQSLKLGSENSGM
jgi:hypothetical protein